MAREMAIHKKTLTDTAEYAYAIPAGTKQLIIQARVGDIQMYSTTGVTTHSWLIKACDVADVHPTPLVLDVEDFVGETIYFVGANTYVLEIILIRYVEH